MQHRFIPNPLYCSSEPKTASLSKHINTAKRVQKKRDFNFHQKILGVDCSACVGGFIAKLKLNYIQLFSHKTHLWNRRDIFISHQILLILPACIFSVKESGFTVSYAKCKRFQPPHFSGTWVWCKMGLEESSWELNIKRRSPAQRKQHLPRHPFPPGTGIILFATDSSHSRGQCLKISQSWVTVEFSSEEKLLGYGEKL